MTEKKYTGLTCRGCLILGNGCGKCEKCIDQRAGIVDGMFKKEKPEQIDSERHIINNLKSVSGTGDGTQLYTVLDTKTGETEIVIEHTIKKRMPATQMAEAERLYHELAEKGGRRAWSIEELIE